MHLSVYDYEKKMRAAEVKELEDRLDAEYDEAHELEERLSTLRETDVKVTELTKELNTSPDYQLPEPPPLMSAKSYMTKLVQPLIDRLKKLLLSMIARYMELKRDYDTLSRKYGRAVQDRAQYSSRVADLTHENDQLKQENRDYRLLRTVVGDARIDAILTQAEAIQTDPRRGQHPHATENPVYGSQTVNSSAYSKR